MIFELDNVSVTANIGATAAVYPTYTICYTRVLRRLERTRESYDQAREKFDRDLARATANLTAAWYTPQQLVQRSLLAKHATRPARMTTDRGDCRRRCWQRLRDYRRLDVVPQIFVS